MRSHLKIITLNFWGGNDMELYKWEMKQTFKSKVFWSIGIALFLIGALFHICDFIEGGMTGYEMFLSNCNDFSSLAMFFIGIFAGLHVTGSFEDRKIQAAIMAGNSRIKVLFAKFLSYVTTVALYFASSVVISSVIGFAMFGTEIEDGSFIRSVIVRAFIFVLAEISYFLICFAVSMFMKKPGIAIIINMVVMLATDIGCQILATKEWAFNIIRFTPVGQSMIVLGDVSNGNIALAASVSVLFIALAAAVSFARFRKEELK